MKEHTQEKAVEQLKRGKKCRGRGKGDESRQAVKDVRSEKKRGSKQSHQLKVTTADTSEKLEANNRAAKTQKREKEFFYGKKGVEAKEEAQEVTPQKQRGNRDSHELEVVNKEEAKDVRSPRQKGSRAPINNTFSKDGDERSDQKKKKTKTSRQDRKQHHRVKNDRKCGVDKGRQPSTNLDDGNRDFMTSPNGHHIPETCHYTNVDSHFGLSDATHFDWSQVPNILTTEDLRQIYSSVHCYSTASADLNIQDANRADFVPPDGHISTYQFDDFHVQPEPWLHGTQHCYYNLECF